MNSLIGINMNGWVSVAFTPPTYLNGSDMVG